MSDSDKFVFNFGEVSWLLVNVFELFSDIVLQSRRASMILPAPLGEAVNCMITIVKKYMQKACLVNQIASFLP